MIFRSLFFLSVLALSACYDGSNSVNSNNEIESANPSAAGESGDVLSTADADQSIDTGHLVGLWNAYVFSSTYEYLPAYFEIMGNGTISVFEDAGDSPGNCYHKYSLQMSERNKGWYILLFSNFNYFGEYELRVTDNELRGTIWNSGYREGYIHGAAGGGTRDFDPIGFSSEPVVGLSSSDFNVCQ